MCRPLSDESPVMDQLFEIDLELPAAGGRGLSETLCRQLRKAIADGRLPPGARLPATRNAARFFGVSRNTAAAVYEQLLSEGYVVTRQGSGTYVAERVPAARPQAAAENRHPPTYRLNEFWLRPEVARDIGFWREPPEAYRAARSPGTPSIEFRPGLVDSRLFPFEVFRQMCARRLRGLERSPASYKSPQGHQGNFHLRAAITRYIALTRAVACGAAEVLVTSGAQQAFDLLARVLVTPGKTTVVVEDPGYPPMRVPMAAAGARIVPVGVDAEGLIVEQLPSDAEVICVSPSHQFPLGVTLSLRRRKALIEFARRHNAVVIEDDYDGEFRFTGSPMEALRTADSADVVFYVGTFSKCMLPALRLGFVVAPPWALPALVAAKNCLDWHCAVPIQLAVASFIAEGHLARHVRKMREIYRARRDRVLSLLNEDLHEWLEPLPSSCGMHVAAVTRTPRDLDAVTRTLLSRQVKLHALSRYYLGTATRSGFIIGYGAADFGEISLGLSSLRSVLADTAESLSSVPGYAAGARRGREAGADRYSAGSGSDPRARAYR
jgi:GntR family transcriptional regulator / MocR family aminotransferase